MCDCDFNPPKFCDTKVVKARKRHQCGECLGDIEPGESYERVTGKWEGDIETFKTCSQCIEMRDEMQLECWCYEQLIVDMSMGDYDHLPCVKEFQIRRALNYQQYQQERQ